VWDVIADFFSEKHSEDVLDALLKHLTARRMEAIASRCSAMWRYRDRKLAGGDCQRLGQFSRWSRRSPSRMDYLQ
jgi:hypothetical protein